MIGALIGVCVVFAVLLGVFALQLTGGDLGDLQGAVVLLVNVLAVCVAGLVLLGLGVVAILARPWRNGHSETLTRPEDATPLFATSAQVPGVAKGRVPGNGGQRTEQARRTARPPRTPAALARQAAPGHERDDEPDRGADGAPQPPRRAAPRQTRSAERRPDGQPVDQPGPPRAKPLPREEEIGGVRVTHDELPARPPRLVDDSPVLGRTCRPTSRAVPDDQAGPATKAARQAVSAAAALEGITSLGAWRVADQDAARARRRAREQARVEAQAAGGDQEEVRRLADRRAQRRPRSAQASRRGAVAHRGPGPAVE